MAHREVYLRVLGLTTDASFTEIKQAYLKLSLKWHPDKSKTLASKKKFQEVNSAYKALCLDQSTSNDAIPPKPDTNTSQINGDQMTVDARSITDAKGGDTILKTAQNVVSLKNLGPIGWVKGKIFDKAIDYSTETFSEYMYDGDIGEFFTDADDTEHVIVNIPLARALVGGHISYTVPSKDPTGDTIPMTDDISGILDGYWLPMRRVDVDGNGEHIVWVIYRISFPVDMGDSDKIEIRQKLLLAQTSAAIFPAIWSLMVRNPFASVSSAVLTVIGIGSYIYQKYYGG